MGGTAGDGSPPHLDRSLIVRALAELFGTALLVFVAAGAGVIDAYAGGGVISRGAAVIAPGALVMALIYAWGPLSGLHINPAVTLAFTLRGVFPLGWALPYVAAQLSGAVLAALLLRGMFGEVASGRTVPIAADGGVLSALVMEVILTAMLVTVILNTATGHRSVGNQAAIAVGSTVALLGLFASPISGASMNPARSLGPDIAAGQLSSSWLYVVGPALGSIIATLGMELFRPARTRAEEVAAEGDDLPMEPGRDEAGFLGRRRYKPS
ncbi:MAG: hypothetical protein HOV80_16730 [Polyangiaceae bacterium]|nr:hypothetical protein [Polyangiaceae bacterium]